MTDRSEIIRHPDVIVEEFHRIARDLDVYRDKITERAQELEQVAEIAYELMLKGMRCERNHAHI